MKSLSIHKSWLVLSLLLGVLYTFATELYANADWFTSLTYGTLVALLCASLSLLLEVQVKLERTDEGISNLATSVQEIIDILRINSDVATTRHELGRRKPYVAQAGIRTLRKYANGFYATDNGYAIEGEQGSLAAYEEFWRLLLEKQKTLGFSDNRRLIARITHSLDIGLWSLREKNNAQTLKQLQEDFVKAGGIVVRILIHTDEKPNAEYIEVMKWMRRVGMDVRYVSSKRSSFSPQFRYDFLLVMNDVENESYVAKWYSSPPGTRLDKCEISDTIDDDLLARWNALVHASIPEYGELDIIPLTRQFGEKSTSSRFPRLYALGRRFTNWGRDHGWVKPELPNSPPDATESSVRDSRGSEELNQDG